MEGIVSPTRLIYNHIANVLLVASPHYLECDKLLLAFLSANDSARGFLKTFLQERRSIHLDASNPNFQIHLDTDDDRDLNIDDIATILMKRYVKDVEVDTARSRSESLSQHQLETSSQLRTWFVSRISSFHSQKIVAHCS